MTAPATPVIARSKGLFLTEITAGRHHWTLDEPQAAGGTDRGPTPYDMLAAALGGCTAMTLHFYARRENLPLEEVAVRVTHDRQHVKDCADCMTKAGFIHRLRVDVSLTGPLSEEQRQHLLEIAGRCPVARTLQAEIRIEHAMVASLD
jgi:putative redox protein